jgi:hypothetical protein
MNISRWLARAASLADRLRRKADQLPSDNDPSNDDSQRDRRRAKRSLATRLPAHLRRDIGADDG